MSKQPARRLRNAPETRDKLVQAAIALILRQGFPKTTVDEICAEAGVTKGSFFHHFENKDAIGHAAADAWGAFGTALYAEAWKDPKGDPLGQLHRFFDIMEGFTRDPENPCTCVVGILSQEMALAHPALRDCCARHLQDWTRNTARLLDAAKAKYPPVAEFSSESVAWHLNALWQGSMLIAKTCQTPEMIRANLRIARHWVDSLFGIASPLPHTPPVSVS